MKSKNVRNHMVLVSCPKVAKSVWANAGYQKYTCTACGGVGHDVVRSPE